MKRYVGNRDLSGRLVNVIGREHASAEFKYVEGKFELQSEMLIRINT